MRVFEALFLQVEDIAFLSDARLAPYGPHIAEMNIRDSKTARHTEKLQYVKLEDPSTVNFLRTWKTVTKRKTGRLVNLSYQGYASHLKDGLIHLGITHALFTSDYARIGKATADYVSGVPVS